MRIYKRMFGTNTQKITEEVYNMLLSKIKNKALVLQNTPDLNLLSDNIIFVYCNYFDEIFKYDTIINTNLTIPSLINLKNRTYTNEIEKALLFSLMNDKKVYQISDNFEFFKTTNEKFKNYYNGCINEVKKMGLCFVNYAFFADSTNLYSFVGEKEVLKVIENGSLKINITKNTKITPLAYDLISEYGIIVTEEK